MVTTGMVQARERVAATGLGRPHGRQLLRHFVEMVLAMAGGMMVVGGVLRAGIDLAGGDYSSLGPEASALLMAFSMSVGMTLWMRHRRHGWRMVVEMDGAMFGSFAVAFPLLWLGVLSEDAMYLLGHALMLPVMLALMLRRRG